MPWARKRGGQALAGCIARRLGEGGRCGVGTRPGECVRLGGERTEKSSITRISGKLSTVSDGFESTCDSAKDAE
jgi:hypothetical protein